MSLDALEAAIMALAGQRPRLVQACAREQDLGPLVAEALVLLSQQCHPEGDRAERPSRQKAEVTADEAAALRDRYGGVRAAARVTGISKDALWRALQRTA